MANNNITGGENIHVKVDQNNLIYIDPNTVISPDGTVSPRGVKQEELTMYVNLEADIIPRSVYLSDENNVSTLRFVAGNKLSFLNAKANASNGQNKDFDTSWTNTFYEQQVGTNQRTQEKYNFQEDTSGQSFGIDSLNIDIKGFNAIPEVTIRFIDVRGKTLFEPAENSPYNAFFHVPWPIFYLTIKGYYGKAIKYRLHLVSFKTKFNETNGNFESNATFVGSTYAWLSDIPLLGILNAAYMFPIESISEPLNNGTTTSRSVVKSTKGFNYLKTIYSEYIKKGYLPQNFPTKTLREIIKAADGLDKMLEQKIFSEVVDLKLFSGIKEFNDNVEEFRGAIVGWARENLDQTAIALNKNDIDYYNLKGEKTDTSKVLGESTPGTLQFLVKKYSDLLQKNDIFVTNLINSTTAFFNKKKFGLGDISNISWSGENPNDIYQTDDPDYTNSTSLDTTKQPPVGNVLIGIDYLVQLIDNIISEFQTQRATLENDVEKQMNQYVKRTDIGLGFEPTIRNLFAIVLANAEAFVRLMQDVHVRALSAGNDRKVDVVNYSSEAKPMDTIFPWPEIKKKNDNNKQNVLVYPGDPSVAKKLRANEANRWPEVDFIENFIGISTNRIDPLAPKEGGTSKIVFDFNNNEDKKETRKINSCDIFNNFNPYVSLIHDNFIYEIWERAINYTLIDSYDTKTIESLANLESENILNASKEDDGLIKLIKDNFSSVENFRNLLNKLAPFNKYYYYLSQLPTTEYIKSFLSNPFKIEQFSNVSNGYGNAMLYSNLNTYLQNYKPESYRRDIYPFSSNIYGGYFYMKNKKLFNLEDLEVKQFLEINTKVGFVAGQIDSKLWVKPNYDVNLFTQRLNVSGQYTHILNTPYFHNQLFSDFTTGTSSKGKYVGSAYLLLNSLPFVDLDDYITFSTNKKVLVSTLFREVNSTQVIPYHLMLKWGSIYHRYKKYISGGGDILNDTINTGFTTTSIDSSKFFNNGSGYTYTNGTTTGITYTGETHLGIHPFYDAIFHQVVNDYQPYNFLLGNAEYSANTNNGNIISHNFTTSADRTYWTSFVDNSKYIQTDDTYTILPSNGMNSDVDKITYDRKTAKLNNLLAGIKYTTQFRDFNNDSQNNYRIFWEQEVFNKDFSGQTFSNPTEYTRIYDENGIYDDQFGVKNGMDFRKVYDLIGTFSPNILEEFEYQFLEFSSERLTTTVDNPPFNNIKYYNFQDLLKEIVTVKKGKITSTAASEQITEIYNQQIEKLKLITQGMLDDNNLVKLTLGNSKELDLHIFHGFAQIDNNNILNYADYTNSTNKYLIDLYIGQEPETDCYLNFFKYANVDLTEQNVKDFRQLALIYAGYNYQYTGKTINDFKTYIKDNIFNKDNDTNSTVRGSAERLSLFLNNVVKKVYKGIVLQNSVNQIDITNGYNDAPLKLETYNHFKSFNDKWIAGNSIGQRNLIEEFLFLDKANRDIGQQYFLNLDRIISLADEGNAKQSLWGTISILLQNTGFDMKALPAYVNYYGANVSAKKPKLTPSKTVASTLFGTFSEVDTQESSPKIIIQYVMNLSKRLDMSEHKKYKYLDDSFDVSSTVNNPVLIENPKVFQTGDLIKSNRVIAFELSFGDQNQGIFKTISLDQSTLKNTTEAFVVLENIAKSESGSSSYNVDVSLYDYYRQAAYSCEVTCMGNVMIQPTMYFYLKNVPMFKGTYWITEVSHKISNNTITTTFKGARMPYMELPDLADSFTSSYRVLFDKISQTAQTKVTNASKNDIKTLVTLTTADGSFIVDVGPKPLEGERVKLVSEAGVDNFGIPYNGYEGEQYLTKIETTTVMGNYPEKQRWYRAYVCTMGGLFDSYSENDNLTFISNLDSTELGSTINPLNMKWSEIRDLSDKYYFYSLRFNFKKAKASDIAKAQISFLNPATNKTYEFIHEYKLDSATNNPRVVKGPVNYGPKTTNGNFGISMSIALMDKLGLKDNDVIYFVVE